jgi:glycosyltransferase involved in cell wall biosynthesis
MPAPEPASDTSWLMAVHDAVDPAHFAVALGSVAAQTMGCREVVVVVDGPVSAAHEQVLTDRAGLVRRVDLATNRGAGEALAAGLSACTSTWVARADADDLCLPERLEVQLALLEASGADVCSAPMLEFQGAPDHVVGVRGCPTSHEAFARRMRVRNPVNHPTVVFRRQAAVDAGGYQQLPYREDYDLWARMLASGARFVGTADPLVQFRVDGMWHRRRAPGQLAAERVLQRRLTSYGLIGPVRAAANVVVRSTYSALPVPVMRSAYRLLVRSPPRTASRQRPRPGHGPR